jgi:MotA/TolQ/ExbB proton channel family
MKPSVFALLQTHNKSHDRVPSMMEPLLMEWLTLFGIFVFSTWFLGLRGVWALLLSSDPTGITLVIIVVFFTSSLWCGARAHELQRQRSSIKSVEPRSESSWAANYFSQVAAKPSDPSIPMDILMDLTHGPHGTAWWVNGIQLKLGLLGKVIGFSILALQIGNMQNFDATQSQDLLRSLTTGLGVALLTTMVGLVGNILLGLQLTRLDRYADALIADIQREGFARARRE